MIEHNYNQIWHKIKANKLIVVNYNFTIISPFLTSTFTTTTTTFYYFFKLHLCYMGVKDKFFTPRGFISLATRTTSTLSWILGKSLLKPKRAHIHTKRRQNPWFKLMAHHLIFWLMIQAHESHWVNFRSRGLEGQEVCSVKLQWFKVDKGKHVAWHVFPNSLNFDKSVCNR